MTLIELQENKADRQIKSVEPDGPDRIKVTLVDGRIHQWRVNGLYAEEKRPTVSLQMTEKTADGTVREESAE